MRPTRPIDVKQYVDGRLEGEGKPSPRGSDIFNYPDDNDATLGIDLARLPPGQQRPARGPFLRRDG